MPMKKKATRGRPPIGPRFELTMPLEMLARLDALAEAKGCSRAEAVRAAVRAGIAAAERRAKQ